MISYAARAEIARQIVEQFRRNGIENTMERAAEVVAQWIRSAGRYSVRCVDHGFVWLPNGPEGRPGRGQLCPPYRVVPPATDDIGEALEWLAAARGVYPGGCISCRASDETGEIAIFYRPDPDAEWIRYDETQRP